MSPYVLTLVNLRVVCLELYEARVPVKNRIWNAHQREGFDKEPLKRFKYLPPGIYANGIHGIPGFRSKHFVEDAAWVCGQRGSNLRDLNSTTEPIDCLGPEAASADGCAQVCPQFAVLIREECANLRAGSSRNKGARHGFPLMMAPSPMKSGGPQRANNASYNKSME